MGNVKKPKDEKSNTKNVNTLFSISALVYSCKLFYKTIVSYTEIDDLKRMRQYGESTNLGNTFETIWEEQLSEYKLKGRKPSLLKALFKMFFCPYMIGGVVVFIQIVLLRPYQSLILAHLFALFAKKDENNRIEMYVAGCLIVSLSFLICFMTHLIFLRNGHIGMKIRIAISSLVYRKMLKLSRESLNHSSVGYVINLLSNDVQRFDTLMLILYYGWISPIQASIVMYYIWQQVGISSLAGLLFILVFNLPIQGYLSSITSSLRTKVSQCTDTRIRIMSEIIKGIKVIKMYAWEESFKKLINNVRNRELKFLTKALYLRGIYLSLMANVQKITLYFTLLSYILITNDISAEIAFSSASYFQLLRVSLGVYFPLVIKEITEILVSIKRIQEFLLLEERSSENEHPSSAQDKQSNKEVVLKNVTISYNFEVNFMENINLRIPPGKFCAIVGPVGSGKSSLLQILLREIAPSSGSVKIGSEVSFCSQEPWLFNTSIRNNILFGQEYNKLLYKLVVKVCNLEKDFERLPEKDKSVIGESRVALSGGQKARVNLARTIYRQADIYLLDDPFSAIDNKVGNDLFRSCMLQFLKGKTRILVTHQVQYLKNADFIIVVGEGKIMSQGSYDEISKLGFLDTLGLEETEISDNKQKLQTQMSVTSIKTEGNEKEGMITNSLSNSRIDIQNMSAFTKYAQSAGSVCFVATLALIFACSQTMFNASDYLLAVWTQKVDSNLLNRTYAHHKRKEEDSDTFPWPLNIIKFNDKKSLHNYFKFLSADPTTTGDNIFYDTASEIEESYNVGESYALLIIYSAFIATAIILTLTGTVVFYKLATTACRNLHQRMFYSLLSTPIKFFDSNPSGQILNRFSKDMGAIDELLPVYLVDTIQVIFSVIGAVVLISISNYYMIAFMLIAGITFMKVQNWYTIVAKETKHLESLAKSPMFSHVSSSYQGITTIRASNAQNILCKEFDSHQDVHSSAWKLVLHCKFVFSLWLELIFCTFVACITFGFIIINDYYPISGSWAGLAISQALMLVGILQTALRNSAETFTQMASVERVLQYTELEEETPLNTPEDAKLNPNWPNKGLIEIQGLSMIIPDYDSIVLDNISVVIKPGEKVGICGRTGAGKSSLVSALFRLATYEGDILIDKVNINDLGLRDIRKKISIIPQEPVLFSDTVRFNLDPYNENSDQELWSAIEQAELKDSIISLDMMVSEGGSNFSVGQRQLICLARAILRNNKILVLDEATASVDPLTDSLIQETIKKKFADCTVLTIAHRLHTIMDSDKVIVMDSGRVVEYDHPHVLISKENGHFYKMALETGVTNLQKMKDIASEAYLSKSDKTVE